MPELPDIELYLHALRPRTLGQQLRGIRLASPFLLRSIEPSVEDVSPKRVVSVQRLGKRIVFGLENDLYLVLHLMIAGRLQWKSPGAKPPGKLGLAAFDFDSGALILTEAGSKRRASLHIVAGPEQLAKHDPGGIEVLETDLDNFRRSLRHENHTLKRVLADPHVFAGIGNAYSDEILHAARLSPLALSQKLGDDEVARLFDAVRSTLAGWRDRLIAETGDRFPAKVTAFREGMAVHGRFGLPCPACGTKVQRIRYADNETNYCPRCQTKGKVLRDRSLSRLLRDDWPMSIEELEERHASK